MHDVLLLTLILMALGFAAWLCVRTMAMRFLLICREHVELSGGTVHGWQISLFPRGPFRYCSEAQVAVRIDYQDAEGEERTLLARTGFTVATGAHQFVWK